MSSEEQQAEENDAPTEVLPEVISMPSRFETVQQKGNIDVWWLYDDGGLAILLPYLLSRQKCWKHCKLRIFTAGSSRNIDQAKLSIDQYRNIIATSVSNQVDSKDLDKHTLRHIRLGELLQEHSSDARLIVITMTVPQRSTSGHEIMARLDIMSRDLPPTLIMRGNQTSVLTFYS